MKLRRTPRRLLAAAVGVAALVVTSSAAAAITAQSNSPAGATAIATAIAAPGTNVTGATFVHHPPVGTPNGTADAPINQFPTDGGTFGILTSGNVHFADDPNSAPNTSADDAGPPVRGATALDITTLAINFTVPAGANCMTFDFKFFSEEHPEFVGTQYNDAFIAEVDATTWTTVGSNIIAPGNIAFDQNGNVVSINSSGPTAMTAGQASGTTYDAATPLLSASSQVTTGSHTLYLSIFDQGDRVLDSAVFLDNLRVGFVANPEQNCKPGAQVVNYSLDVQPASDENPVGTPHTVTATLEDDDGNPVAGATLTFTVSGANTAAGTGVTNASGEATFTYTGTNMGDDQIFVCYDADANSTCEAQGSATKKWVIGPPASLDLQPETATNAAGEEHCVEATVEDANGNGTPGIVVNFSVSGANTASGAATTDSNGVAEFCYTGTNAGEDTITATAVGGSNPSDTAKKTYTAAAPATLDLTPAAATNVVGTQHCVTAAVEDAYGNEVGGVAVRFSTSGSSSASGSVTTGSNGTAQFCYTGPALPGADVISAYADTDGDSTQDAGEPGETAAKTWVLPASTEGCKVTYGGRILAANGDKATFGGNAHVPPKGEQNYQDHGPAMDLHVKSITTTAVTCSADGKTASIFGTATVNGAGSYDYRIDLRDAAEPGSSDRYRIRLSNGYDSGDQQLQGGNVQIHKQ